MTKFSKSAKGNRFSAKAQKPKSSGKGTADQKSARAANFRSGSLSSTPAGFTIPD